MFQRRRSFLMYSAAVTAASCSRRSAVSRRVRLVIAGTPANLSFLPHTVAQELSLYSKAGLTVAVDAVPGGTKGVQALLGGSADVVLGYYDHSIRMAAQKQSIRSFVTLTRYPGNVVITSPQSVQRIRSIQDLKHSSVGVPDVGSQAHLFLNYLLVRHGLSPSDVNPIATGTQAAAIAALERGRLDALSSYEPAVTQVLKRHPSVRILADARTREAVHDTFGVDEYPGSVLYTKADWLERNPDSARRLARAILAALRWIHQHSLDEVMAVVPASYIGESGTVYHEALANSMSMFSNDGAMPAGGPEAAKRVIGSSLEEVRNSDIDLTKTYTNEFVATY